MKSRRRPRVRQHDDGAGPINTGFILDVTEGSALYDDPCTVGCCGCFSLFPSGNGKGVSVSTAFYHLVQGKAAHKSEDDGENRYPDRSSRGSVSRLVCGAFWFIAGWCGRLAVLCIWQSIDLVFRFIVARKQLAFLPECVRMVNARYRMKEKAN